MRQHDPIRDLRPGAAVRHINHRLKFRRSGGRLDDVQRHDPFAAEREQHLLGNPSIVLLDHFVLHRLGLAAGMCKLKAHTLEGIIVDGLTAQERRIPIHTHRFEQRGLHRHAKRVHQAQSVLRRAVQRIDRIRIQIEPRVVAPCAAHGERLSACLIPHPFAHVAGGVHRSPRADAHFARRGHRTVRLEVAGTRDGRGCPRPGVARGKGGTRPMMHRRQR